MLFDTPDVDPNCIKITNELKIRPICIAEYMLGISYETLRIQSIRKDLMIL